MIQSSKSLTIEQFIPSERFKDNYDKIFGKKPTILSWSDVPDVMPEATEETKAEEDHNGSPG
jgi:hypothetical protein